jgi:hypothetical protein
MTIVRTIPSRYAAATAAVALAVGLGMTAPAPALARTSVSIGIGVGPTYSYYGRPWHRYWGPRPYWYGASWYRPYYAWGPAFNFYVAFPPAYVNTWPEAARVYHRDAYSAALSGPIGEAYAWDDGYDHGAVTAVRDGHQGDRYCREIRQEVSIRGGRPEEASSAACRDFDGSWRVVPNNP